ncbi:MAG: hypothetical protein HC802_21995 [Caldilineaceae bacterium]|nr:hypothetical protein [Caldilineaceae bacterium]
MQIVESLIISYNTSILSIWNIGVKFPEFWSFFIARLRAPDGCPWDREQTLESLRSGLLDEANEVLEAIDAEASGDDNTPHIAEELGDLLLVTLMMVQIATEEGRFHLADVTHSIVTKLIRRHPTSLAISNWRL